MRRGGKREGAGRRAVLSAVEMERVGQACERVWYWLSGTNRRPYYARPYVLLSAAIFYSEKLDRLVSPRRIEAAWKHVRALRIGPAQPLRLAYEDARSIDDWLHRRLERETRDAESETFERLPWG